MLIIYLEYIIIKIPPGLETETSGTYISKYFPQGLLYACLVEAYGFLKRSN